MTRKRDRVAALIVIRRVAQWHARRAEAYETDGRDFGARAHRAAIANLNARKARILAAIADENQRGNR